MPDPLATLILTRPRPASDRFLEQLGDAVPETVRVVVSPLMEIVPTGVTPDWEGRRGVIFTSANGVDHAGPARDLPAYCVGTATTAAAAAAGWDARFAGETADALVETLVMSSPPGPLLHVGGVHRRGDVAERLTRAGVATEAVDVYDQVTLPLTANARDALAGALPVIVALFSPRAARHFAEVASPVAPLYIAGLSEAVLAETQGLAAAARVASARPDAQSMGDTVANLLRRVEATHAPK